MLAGLIALGAAPIAIVSGNAFDKGLDNDVGIGADDFVLKPVRVNELLDGLGARLQLMWPEALAHAARAPPQVQAIEWALPDAQQLHALDASHTGFVNHMHTLARQFQFQLDAMTRIIRQGFAVG